MWQSRRNRALLSGGIVLLLVLLGAGLWWWDETRRVPVLSVIDQQEVSQTALPVLPILAEKGIALTYNGEEPPIMQTQALYLAAQFAPEAASKAKRTGVVYGSLTYAKGNMVPAWMVWYQQVPLPSPDPVTDTPSLRVYDVFVFLDARYGVHLLSVWDGKK
ncbi:hypothetical protein EI42_00363 [Thermosporothrix hazakensis]|jgi:hypothetical protein|uniref:Uncharacterized protein n=1 Tax=Thermosporothrix hazakensis TaxID=644383 RepID=A0A326UEC0_THEHA|nr:hypothetical protein [Thermosporothrix hazakensis]PZW36191.1 hypothetical protein EI42_00363 [Thermosporothrix hazakensis]GCE46842.1 hypothetical protein KTH_17110 [Thermosporothrix hazakensis]